MAAGIIEEVEEYVREYWEFARFEGAGAIAIALGKDFYWRWKTGLADCDRGAGVQHKLYIYISLRFDERRNPTLGTKVRIVLKEV